MKRRIAAIFSIVLIVSHAELHTSSGQARLTETNSETTVSEISFKFGTTQTFEDVRLRAQIATTAGGFLYGVKKFLSFLPFVSAEIHSLRPLELQRDVVRLRRFYASQGFLHAEINYFASQHDKKKNRVHVIFSIQEGEPLLVTKLDVEGLENMPSEIDAELPRLRRRLAFPDGDRYTDFESTRMENELITFLQNRGYPFAGVTPTVKLDSVANEVVTEYRIDTGPRARVDEIVIEGNNSVDDRVVLRELPLRVGDYFSRRKLSQGQSDIFGMNLFRFALVEIPDQPADSLVHVRYRVGESNRRSVTVSAGYSRELGLSLEGSFINRNFFGGARSATFSAITETGLLSAPGNGRVPRKSTRLTVSIRQPYVFRRGLSLTLAPFYNRLNDPNQSTDYYTAGATSTLLWRLLEYRNATFEYTFSHSVPLSGRGTDEQFGLYNTNSYAVGISIGRLDDYLNPKRGYFIRPRFEASGTLLPSGVSYRKGSIAGQYYTPVTRKTGIALTLTYGLMVPFGSSSDQTDPETEFRFDGIRFYAGGSNDVRGWSLNEIGPQIAYGDSIFYNDAGVPSVRNALYEAYGGQAKLSGSVEFRFPIPKMADAFRFGIFLDFGMLSARFKDGGEKNAFQLTSEVVTDDGHLAGATPQFGTGGGIRYATPVGSIRFDIAYKLTPSYTDLRRPEDVILYREGLTNVEPQANNRRRWNFHLSLDRSF